jgi:hypothetical protein
MKFDLPNNENDYMILESIKSAPAKVIHVFDLKDCDGKNFGSEIAQCNEFKVGRSVDTDMKIADISVSRIHSFIRILGNKLVVEDNGSKFGTLVKIFSPSQILSLHDQNGNDYKNRFKFNAKIFQIGRTMFYFKLYDQESKLVSKD